VEDALGHHLDLPRDASHATTHLAEAVGLLSTGVVDVRDPGLVVLRNVPERGVTGGDDRVELPESVGTLPRKEIGDEPKPGLLCESDRGALECVPTLDICGLDVSVSPAKVNRRVECSREFPRHPFSAPVTVCRPVRDADVVFCHSVKWTMPNPSTSAVSANSIVISGLSCC